MDCRDYETEVDRLCRTLRVCVFICIMVGAWFLFWHVKDQYDLDSFYQERLRRCHYIILNPNKSAGDDDYTYLEHREIENQMRLDGYSRSQVEKIDQKALMKTLRDHKYIKEGK